MSKENTKSLRATLLFLDFLDNTRATRRSKLIGTDKKLLSQCDTCSIIEQFFKANPTIFSELVKFRGANINGNV